MPLDPITGSIIAGLGSTILNSIFNKPSRSERQALDQQGRVASEEAAILKMFADLARVIRAKVDNADFGPTPEMAQEFFGGPGGIIGRIGDEGGFVRGGIGDLLASGKLDPGALTEIEQLMNLAGLVRGVGTGTVSQVGSQAFQQGQNRLVLGAQTSGAIAQLVAGLLQRRQSQSPGALGGGALNLGGVQTTLPPFQLGGF